MSCENLRKAHLILASASPRRALILKNLGVPFEIMVSRAVEEDDLSGDPVKHVLALSRRKAEDVAGRLQEGVVVGADTVVVSEGKIMGKPRDACEAASMLSSLSGRVHQVLTGLTLIDAAGSRVVSDYERTKVKFRALSNDEIEAYVASGEPMDKAGAYGIQGIGALLVEGIEGCFYNVVGLPVVKLMILLDKLRGLDGSEGTG